MVGWATVGYAGLTVIMTWPMAVRPGVPYAHIQSDFGLWLWDVWWMKKVLVDLGSSPYFTSYIFHPTGTSLVFHNLSPYNGLVGIPLQLLGADVITAYNLLYLSSFVLGGVGSFLLVKELTGNSFASFLAGSAFAFSPWHTLTYQWTNLWSIQWLPFGLWFAVRVLRVGRVWDEVGLAVALALATLTDWHQPVFLLLAIAVLAFSSVLGHERQRFVKTGVFRRLLRSFLLYALLVSPLAYVVIRELGTGDAILQTPTLFRSFELLGLRLRNGVISYGVLLGWIPVAVVVYGKLGWSDFWTRRFAALLVLFFILSLGEHLKIPILAEPILPLPFLFWRKIPLLGVIRTSCYFWLMVQVCFAVLVGHGASRLWERMEGWHLGRRALPRWVPGVGLLALMLLEAALVPLSPEPVRIHPVYEAIRDADTNGAVLEAPIQYRWGSVAHNAGRSMYLQTVHNRPLVGGYTQFDGRRRLAFLDENPVLMLFTDQWTSLAGDLPDLDERLRAFLRSYDIGWIVLQKHLRARICDPDWRPGWSARKLLILLAPSVVNPELEYLWGRGGYYCSDWEFGKVQRVNALLRRSLGPPLWDDAELAAYRVK
jgi:hypothetical protein